MPEPRIGREARSGGSEVMANSADLAAILEAAARGDEKAARRRVLALPAAERYALVVQFETLAEIARESVDCPCGANAAGADDPRIVKGQAWHPRCLSAFRAAGGQP